MLVTLRAKILAGYIFIVIFTAGFGLYLGWSFSTDERRALRASGYISLAQQENIEIYESLVNINIGAIDVIASDYLSGGSFLSESPAKINRNFDGADNYIASIPPDFLPELKTSLSSSLNNFHIQWYKFQAQINEFQRQAIDREKAVIFYKNVMFPTFNHLLEINRTLTEQLKEAIVTTNNSDTAARENAFKTVVFTIIVWIFIGAIISMIIARQTLKPLKQLGQSLNRIREGNLDARLHIIGADELGEVSFEFNRMAERIEVFEKINIDKLIAEKSKSEAIISSLNEPLFLFDSKGILILANAKAEEMLNKVESEVIGKTLSQLFANEPLLSENSKENIGSKLPVIEYRVKDARRFYSVTSTEIIADAGSHTPIVIGTLLYFTDITHFEELDRMKNDFLGKVSHEFRTPLTSITMALDILAAEKIGVLNAEQSELVVSSKTDSERLAKLVRDLLVVSKLAQPGNNSEIEAFDAAPISSKIITSITRLYQDKKVALSSEIPTDFSIKMKPEHFESLLQNLLSNALSYTLSGGSVDLTLKLLTNSWVLSVVDTGIGIAEADQKKIFERFVQLKPKDMATAGSIGLGLAIVKDIVELYHGTIEVQSTIGKGTRFTLSFPIDKP